MSQDYLSSRLLEAVWEGSWDLHLPVTLAKAYEAWSLVTWFLYLPQSSTKYSVSSCISLMAHHADEALSQPPFFKASQTGVRAGTVAPGVRAKGKVSEGQSH